MNTLRALASRGGISRRGAAVAVGVIALLLFLPSLSNGFAYDDVPLIQNDARVHGLDSVLTILRTGYWGDGPLGLYRPLTTLSFALDWTLSGGAPAWFHFTNAALHAAASVLAFLLLCRFFGTGAAFAGALIFAVHPVHTEAVANVVGRADVLSAALVFAACLVWTTERASPQWRWSRVGLVAAISGLALLTKESAVMLPSLILLIDAARGSLRLRGIREYLRREALPFAAMAFVLAACLGVRFLVLNGLAPSRIDAALEVAPSAAGRVATALQAWPEYVRLLVFPRTLLADYGPRVLMPSVGWTAAAAAGGALLLGSVVGGMMALARRHPRAALGLLWFPIAILPVSNLLIPIGVVVAERTLYLPSFAIGIGVAGIVAVAAGLLAQVVDGRESTSRMRRRPAAAAAAAVAVIALLMVRTLDRIPEWESTDTIMLALAEDRPDSFRGAWYLARRARARGDAVLAGQRYAQALHLWPYRKRLVMEAAGFAAETGNVRHAFDIARFAVDTWPDDVGAQRLLAGSALDLGDTTTARHAVRAGLEIEPRDALLRRMDAAIPKPDPMLDR